MRLLAMTLIVSVECAITSCVTVGGAPVTGRAHDVSTADVRAAIAADIPRGGQPFEIDVINKNEIHLYYVPRQGNESATHHIIKRVNGRWEYAGGVLVTS
jgi:hypothetical protein